MNQEKIGKFIAICRKEKNLTQSQLAEKLNITDKAISKWETGRGMPDSSMLLELCKILDINVNELLSGEKLSLEKYQAKAERNMLSFVEETKRSKSNTKKIIIFFSIALIVFLIITGIYFKHRENTLYSSDGTPLNQIEISNYTHMIVKGKIVGTDNEYMIIYTLDNNDKVVNVRNITTYTNEEEAKEVYNNLRDSSTHSKVKLEGNIVICNDASNGLLKESLLKLYNDRKDIEIIEY